MHSSEPSQEAARAPASVYGATFLLAASVLVLEIALTRVFSVLTWHHFTSMIISIALLGFGAAGSTIAVLGRERFGPARFPSLAMTYAASILGSFVLVTRIELEPLRIFADWTQSLSLVLVYVFLALPFFFAGLCLAGIVTAHHRDIHRVYFADLAGGSAGSLTAVALVSWVGAPGCVVLAALLGTLVAFLLRDRSSPASSRRLAMAGVGALVLFVATVVGDPYLVHVPSSKDMFTFANAAIGAEAIEYSKWHIVARVDVTKPLQAGAAGGPQLEYRWAFQDGAAPTYMLHTDGNVGAMTFLGDLLAALPYKIVAKPEVLVIGVGGGTDILIALHHQAAHVTGAEINPMMIRAITRDFRDYTGSVFLRPEVTLHCSEGRHFVSRSRGSFDIIQLTGVDTFTALSSGAYALAENYVYTVEAIEDFWRHLTPDGVLSFDRRYLAPPRESLKLVATMVEALERMGVPEPARHLAVVTDSRYTETLLKRSPITDADMAAIRDFASRQGRQVLFDPEKDAGSPFDTVIRSPRADRERFFASYVYAVEPTTDDTPFFFNYYKWRNILKPSGPSTGGYVTTSFPLGLITLAWSLVQIALLAFLGILLPMQDRSAFAAPGSGRSIVYFGALGLGFIFVEIGLIQKLMVFLGGPAYSMAITLFSILLFSGLGSLWARDPKGSVAARAARLGTAIVVLVPVLGLALHHGVPRMLVLPWVARAAVAVACVAPLAFLMGMPFPTGLHALGRSEPGWVPWAWSVNSFMTVLGALLAILVSMEIGFRGVFYVAAAVYAIGFFAFLPVLRRLEG